MIINHNLPGANAINKMNANSATASKSMQKLSSGLRINGAADDAAGLAISEKMRGQIRGLDQASANAQDGISMIQTAEGALNETQSILQRMRELSDQSANGTNTDADRKSIQDEVTQLKNEVDRIGNDTEFNTQKLLNGSLKSAGGVSIGQNTTTGAIVGKQESGKLSGTITAAKTGDFVQETINVDGTDIKVNWQDLSTAEKSVLTAATTDAASKNAAAELVVRKINEAIDASGKNVAHVSGYSDGSKLVIESGSKGTESIVKIGSAGILKGMTASATGTAGTNKYNGTDIAGGDADLLVNGTLLKVTIAAVSNGATMDSTAASLQSAIKTAIDDYNTATGKTAGQDGYMEAVTVKATNDGSFSLTSEAGPVELRNTTGSTIVTDLGLTQAQTEAGGNGGMTFQIGANKGQTITFGVNDMRSAALGISGLDVSTASGAQSSLDTLDKAIASVSSERGKLGAIQNRLEHTINNLGTSSENLTSAESRIRDVDMAKEMSTFSKNNILSQAAQAMLAQANTQPQQVLQLLR